MGKFKINTDHLNNVLERKQFRTEQDDMYSIETQMLNHKVQSSYYPKAYKLKDNVAKDLKRNKPAREYICGILNIDDKALMMSLRRNSQILTQKRYEALIIVALNYPVDADIYEEL